MTRNPLRQAAELMTGAVMVTGTDTNVGKTYATAALALAGYLAGRRRIAVYKPVQTGVGPGDLGDSADVARLLGAAGVPRAVFDVAEGQRLRAPMAPPPAADLEGVKLLSLDEHAARITALLRDHDVVLVEGSGGVLVELDDGGHNIADLTNLIGRNFDVRAGVVLVGRPDLGTLNHTLLSLEALRHRGVHVLGTVLGSWPANPETLHRTNRDYIADIHAEDGTGIPLLGAVPHGWRPGVESAALVDPLPSAKR